MDSREALRDRLGSAMGGARTALEAADQLCLACVELLDVDGAAVSLIDGGATRGTFGSSGPLSRLLDELQFTFGEGPCLDTVRSGAPVLVEDLSSPAEQRWPAFRDAVQATGVAAVFALPVTIAAHRIGALDLFNTQAGAMTDASLDGALLAAELAALPLLDLMTAQVDWDRAGEGDDGWERLASLERVEVYQATGMLMAALGVTPGEALARLRAHAFAHGTTASEVAWAVVERRLRVHPGGIGPTTDTTPGGTHGR